MERQELISAACKFVGQEMSLQHIDPSVELKSLGLDSFRIIELVLFLERKTGNTFPESAYTPANLKSVNTIAECFLRLEK